MSDDNPPVLIKILDKEYRIACEAGEEEDVLASAQLLDSRMRDVRSKGKILGLERIAVMAALNMAHELLHQERPRNANSAEKRIRDLRARIETVLNEGDPLEL